MTAQTRRNAVEKAIVLSSRYGFDQISYKEIAFEVDLSEEDLDREFPKREDLLDAILEYIADVVDHYNPNAEDIDEMMQAGASPTAILERFVTAYPLHDDAMARSIYRFIMMEQSRNEKIYRFAVRHIMNPPIENATFMIDHLIARGAIPPCNSRIIAEMWNRTSLVFEMLTTHDMVSIEEYHGMTGFYIQMLVRGVQEVPSGYIDAQWTPRPDFSALLAQTDSARQRVMLTALDLFGRCGYANVSMSQIAQECGLSLTATYRKYHSKSAIMQDIVVLMMNTNRILEGDQVFRTAWKTSDEGRITLTLADSYSNVKDEHVRKLYRILFREQYYNEDLKDYLIGSLYRDIENITAGLNALAEQGRIPPCDARRIATSFVYTMLSFTIDAALGGSDDEQIRLQAIAVLVSLILNGFLHDEDGRDPQ